MLHAYAVQVRGIFLAEDLAELRVHKLLPQSPKHILFELVLADRQAIGANCFAPIAR